MRLLVTQWINTRHNGVTWSCLCVRHFTAAAAAYTAQNAACLQTLCEQQLPLLAPNEAYLHPLLVVVIVQETACFANDHRELSALAIPFAVALVLQASCAMPLVSG